MSILLRCSPSILLIMWLVSVCSFVRAESSITAADARRYIGEFKVVCGTVASTSFSNRSRRQPTFINLDQSYPNHIFTVLIWGSDRTKFKVPPEVYYREKKICVSGVISSYQDKPQIIVSDPSQIHER